MNNENTASLVYHLRDYLANINITELGPFLRLWPEPDAPLRFIPESTLPVLRWLPEMIQAAAVSTRTLVKKVAGCADRLAWGQTYSSDDFGSLFLERYGWTELVGQRGLVPSRHLACGLLLLGPETEYPMHRHEAEEVYIPLTVGTDWKRGEEGWIRRKPGLPIYHGTWIPHGMRTGSAPLMALYLWHGGDLTQKSIIV